MINYFLKILVVIVVSTVLTFYPLHVAQSLAVILYHLKEFVLDLIARLIARAILSALQNSILSKILELGREGGPAFIENWREFKEDGQYRGEDLFRAMLADLPVCDYLRKEINDVFTTGGNIVAGADPGLNRVYNLQSYGSRNACDLSGSIDVDIFRNDFAKGGGWRTWNQLIRPRNNMYGLYADSITELLNQRVFDEQVDVDEGRSGSGYISSRSGCEGRGANKRCIILGKVLTPGDVFSESTAETINAELDWLTDADELSEVILIAATSIVLRLTALAANAIVGDDELGDDAARRDSEGDRVKSACVDRCVSNTCADIPTPVECKTTCEGTTDSDGDTTEECTEKCVAE